MLAFAALAGAICLILMVRSPSAPKVSVGRGPHLTAPSLGPSSSPGVLTFDRAQSAALFIGVRRFTQEHTLDVQYAADDAVDLAYAFSLGRPALVVPSRVVIALSGQPQKEVSKQHLAALRREGAQVRKATSADILSSLQQQTALTGTGGILIVAIATHGFAKDGVPYILGSSSMFRYPETALPLPRLFEIAAASEAPRSLFLVDACRERMTDEARAGASAETAAPLITRMKHINGQVVFYAAAGGGYAYDGDGNGVFTKAVLDGLDCHAATSRGVVTAETLHRFVERTVLRWIREHHNPGLGAATQVSMDGATRNMPLCSCIGPPPPPPPADVDHATSNGTIIRAFGSDGSPLWSRAMNEAITSVRVTDLDGDGSHDVLLTTAHGMHLFDRAGRNVWSVTGKMTLQTLAIDHLVRHDPTLQIAAAWNDHPESRFVISTYNAAGKLLSTYNHRGNAQHMAIDRPTSHHNRMIIVSGTSDAGASFGTRKPPALLVMLNSKAELSWEGMLLPPTERLISLQTASRDKYSRDITLSTNDGETMHLDFDGNTLERTSTRLKLQLLPRKAHHRESS